MIAFKKFTSKSVPSTEEFQAAMPKRAGKVFTPGIYTLTIHSVEDAGESKPDKTWTQLKLNLVGENKQIKHWIDIPTNSIAYNFGPDSSRNAFGPFLTLQSFVRALGGELEPTPESLNEILPGLFGSPEALIGQEVGVEIGYFGYHIAYNVDEKAYFIADKSGKPVDEDVYEDRNVAELEAASAGLRIQKFPRVLRFVPADGGSLE